MISTTPTRRVALAMLSLLSACDWEALSTRYGAPGSDGGVISSMHNVAFVTSTTYRMAALGGAAGADRECQARADAAGIASGPFKAWIATSTESAAARLANTGARGWVRTDGRPFADSIASLLGNTGQMLYPLRLDELGNDLAGAAGSSLWVATGANTDGSAEDTCSDWSSTTGTYMAGLATGATVYWTFVDSRACATTEARLYCFGTARQEPIDLTALASTQGRRAFVSRSAHSPGGGLASADAKCQADAQAAGLVGDYLALLATTSASAASRFDLTGTTWVRPDGVAWLEQASDLPLNRFASALNVNPDREQRGYDYAWTGTDDLNTPGGAAKSCADWTSTSMSAEGFRGRLGYSDRSLVSLNNDKPATCDSAALIYCLER